MDAPLEASNGAFKAHLAHLPTALRERIAARGLSDSIRIAFAEPAPVGAALVTRSHPLPAILAEALIEGALDPIGRDKLGRVGAWPNPAVAEMSTIALLRLRFKLTVHGRRERILLVEEANALAFRPSGAATVSGEEARGLLEPQAVRDLASIAKERLLKQAFERMATLHAGAIADFARTRAEALASDHARVRATGVNVPRVSVEAVLPADIVGLFVLIPAGA